MINNDFILVVDDDEHDQTLIVSALRQRDGFPGVSVTVAQDGSHAMDYLLCRGEFETRPRHNPSMILLDLHMPRIDGLEVLAEIKRDGRLRTIPVVMFSSSERDEDVLRSYQLGVNAYVVKPMEYDRFMEVVRQIAMFWFKHNIHPPPSGARGGAPDAIAV